MHEILVNKLKKRAGKEDVDVLAEVAEMLMAEIKEEDYDIYKCAENKMYEAYYGKKLTEELAEKMIHKMKPHGMKWTLEQTNEVMKNHSLNLDKIDFWYVMNMAYNDYSDMFNEELEKYTKFSELFINDEDAKDGKVYIYATKIAD